MSGPRPLLRRLLPRRLRGRGESGYTLVELVVVMLVLGIVMAMFVPFIGTVSRAAQTTQTIQKATAQGRIALQSIETQIGSASQVCLLGTSGEAPTSSTTCGTSPGSTDGVQVYTGAFSASAQRCVRWWYQAPTAGAPGQLLQETFPYGDACGASTDGAITVVAGSTTTSDLTPCTFAPPTTTPTSTTTSTTTATSSTGGVFSLAYPPAASSGTSGTSGTSGGQGTALLTISVAVTCGSGAHQASVSLQSTTAALDTALGG